MTNFIQNNIIQESRIYMPNVGHILKGKSMQGEHKGTFFKE